MKKIIYIILIFIFYLNSTVAFASNTLHLVWDKTPIDITLPVDQERMISFPGVVKFGYDEDALPPSILNVVNNNGTVYLTAKKAFQSEPIQILLVKSGKIILMNIAAQPGVSDTPVDIILSGDSTTESSKGSGDAPMVKSINYGALIQFAAQQLYAPERLLTDPNNIFRTPMETKNQVPLLLDGSVLANPLISWREGDAYITAVQVYNNENFAITLDPAVFCGQWQMAAFYPRKTIERQSVSNDNTTVFLISTQPFGQAISECMSSYQEGSND